MLFLQQSATALHRPTVWINSWFLLCCLSNMFANVTLAQTWEYSPYKVLVWIAAEPSPLLPDATVQHCLTLLPEHAHTSVGYVWQPHAELCPAALADSILADHAAISFSQLLTTESKIPPADKVFTIALREENNTYQLSVREWDITTQQGGLPRTLETSVPENLPSLLLTGLLDTFRVSTKIEKVDGRNIQIRVRAGGLLTDKNSPANVQPGDILQPVVRRNQRNGLPLQTNGIMAPAWSYLVIEKPLLPNESEAAAPTPEQPVAAALSLPTQYVTTLHTGFASVIPAKGSSRTERYALMVKRYFSETEIQVRAKREVVMPGETTANKKPKYELYPLAEYEIFDKAIGEEKSKLLGLTDWQGRLQVATSAQPLRILYIRNGGQFLARLPIVPGHTPSMSIDVLDDDLRLQAEAIFRALQSRVLDVVARREILTFRLRAKISQRKFDEARQLVTEFRSLPTRVDLQRELADARKRHKISSQRVTQARVNKIFLDAEKMITQFMTANSEDVYLREIAAAEKTPLVNPESEEPAESPNKTLPAPPAESPASAESSPEIPAKSETPVEPENNTP